MKNEELAARVDAITSGIADNQLRMDVKTALLDAGGRWNVALSTLQNRMPQGVLETVTFAHTIADASGSNVEVVKALTSMPQRDAALSFNVTRLIDLMAPNAVAGSPAYKSAEAAANAVNRQLFVAQPTAVLQRMVAEREIPIADSASRDGVVRVLDNLPEFNIRATSVYKAMQDPRAFEGVTDDQRAQVVDQLKKLALVQAISPVPEAIPILLKANIGAAFQVAEMPQSTFVEAYGPALGNDVAMQVHTHAVNTRIRNEHVLMATREAVRGAGLAIIDGTDTQESRLLRLQKAVDNNGVPLNLETLFGGSDYCECNDCLSVYSPASYYVEVLQYLRNNNLDPKNPNTGIKGIAGTPLEKLFRRRPDLKCLELTCENTFTVLPYIDLVNEVMESFVVHLGDYHADGNVPKQATLEVFNVSDETTDELLAQPQHINYEAYCILKSAVYPFTLPYHQPIDAIRIFLNYLKTSRREVLETYRAAHEPGIAALANLTAADKVELQGLHEQTLDRAVDAEVLGMTQEEYIILAREAFWAKRYFDITQKPAVISDQNYRDNIGVRPVHQYYGYGTEADMLSTDEDPVAGQLGLTFVKKQFLQRTGIQYVDLVDILKTRFINPNYPDGMALTVLESIRFSYRFLQSLVDTSSPDPKIRFGKLIDFLEKAQPLVPLIDALLHPDPCKQQSNDPCMCTEDIRQWVYCYFERIGELIVLESGEGPRLPIEGRIYAPGDPPSFVGTLRNDGTVRDGRGTLIAQVTITGQVLASDGQPLVKHYNNDTLVIVDGDGKAVAYIDGMGLRDRREGRIHWLPARDTCDLDRVRLTHLDGTAVTVAEYDRLHRFIRLWRKLGWTIDETDQALQGGAAGAVGGAGAKAGGAAGEGNGSEPKAVGFDTFKDDCAIPDGGGESGCNQDCGSTNWPCPDPKDSSWDINADFLHQLAYIKRLLDKTGLPLPKLLSFWADIGTAGTTSLYASLFLKHNLAAIDPVFKADQNGNFLTQSTTIVEHLPVLMAALRLKADDIAAIKDFTKITDALTLDNVSVLYRYSLLMKLLKVKAYQLADIVALIGDPFVSPEASWVFLDTWDKMSTAGFTVRQLNYIVQDHDDPYKPLAPTQITVLKLAKTLYDGLNGIDRDQPDVTAAMKDQVTDELIRAKMSLVFDQASVDAVIGVLEGTTSYSTNAPVGLNIAVPAALAKKLAYQPVKDAMPAEAVLLVTGILTDAEVLAAKALSADPGWAAAIDRIGKQKVNVFNDVLTGVFGDANAAQAQLLAGDVIVDGNTADPANTAPKKRLYFLQNFMPYLRQRLDHRLIVDTMAGATSLASDITDLLLSDILLVNGGQHALDVLESIKNPPPAAPAGWKGFLIPPADGTYTFIAKGDAQPADLVLDGQSLAFSVQQADPSNVWSTDPAKAVSLKAGKLYVFELADRTADKLFWKSSTSAKVAIPSASLLPDYASAGTSESLIKLIKSALLVNGFTLTRDEVSYWQNHGADFDGFDFNAVSLKQWLHLWAYADLRDALPKTDSSLLDLFGWAGNPDDPAKLSAHIAASTLWNQASVDECISADHFDLNDPANFVSEKNLVKLRRAIDLGTNIGVDVDRLFSWARPGSKFWECHLIAEDIRKAIHARFNEDDWEQVVKPLNDQLRQNQQQALISYLLVQSDLIQWAANHGEVLDANTLFEFFLIDVQMCSCMETSRIKQAISSVQLFVQRCMLGLEEQLDGAGNQVGVAHDVLDRDRWEWMQKYRVWEANRKVFLYPENWIDPTLRDDKSPFYKELESELLQKEINTQNVQDALKNYLFKLDEVAHLQVVGLYYDDGPANKLHVFGRTHNAPYFFYYRYFDVAERNWYPWEKMQVDIPSYDVAPNAFDPVQGSGSYLAPAVWNNRLLVFFPQINVKTKPKSSDNSIKGNVDGSGNFSAADNSPVNYTEIKLAWSEYRNGKWTQKQLAKDTLSYDIGATSVPHYAFIPDVQDDRVLINVLCETRLETFGVDVASDAAGNLDIYAAGPEKEVWHKRLSGGKWSAWEGLGGVITSDPAAVDFKNGQRHVFVRGTDNALWHNIYDNGAWSGWNFRGGTLITSPTVTSLQDGRLDVFALKTGQDLWHTWSNDSGATWQEADNEVSMPVGWSLNSDPAAVSWGKNRIDVFARGIDLGLWHAWWDGAKWNNWEPLGGILVSGPAVCSWGNGRLDVFARGLNGALWHKAYDNNNWGQWEDLGGSITSDPAAVCWGPNRIDVIARGAASDLVHLSYDGQWSAWESLGGIQMSFGAYEFLGSKLYRSPDSDPVALQMPDYFQFYTSTRQMHSLQLIAGQPTPEFVQTEPYFEAASLNQHEFSVHPAPGDTHYFYHPYAHNLLGRANADNLDRLFGYYAEPGVMLALNEGEAFGDDAVAQYHELKRSYSLYNWELGFHSVMGLVDRALKAQQFDLALTFIHYVLDPSAKGNDATRFWQFPPFKEIDATQSIEDFFLGLQPNASESTINEWRDKPFRPHVVARSRPSAYMKYVAMKYIEILIAYGDYYYRQYTLETLPLAIQCYVLAAHLYGPKGQMIPRRGKVKAETYASLLDRWDAFGNAMVELELAFPFSNQTPLPIGVSNGVVGFANVFGFATALYFCIPDNPQMRALRTTIDDRLFNIRHCRDINGVFRLPPLFEPPIDPALLVAATAQGLSISSVLNDLNSPMPNYRFYYLLQKALELCNELKSLGNSLLSAKEKGDAEAMAQMRARHETGIQTLLMDVKKLQLDESQKSLDALQQSRLGPASRMAFYLGLIGEDLGKVPQTDGDFNELPNANEPPVSEGGLKLIAFEKEEMDKAAEAKDWQTGIGIAETLASVFHIIPALSPNAEPMGVGLSTTVFSGTMLGNAAQAVARGLQIHANDLTYQSTTASRKGGFMRQLQDRIQQANAAGYEVKHIDKQILAQQIRIDLANKEIDNQQQQIDNAQEVEDYLKSKYTNQELYTWMEGEVRTLYYQAYTLAYDLAKRAERVFAFERGLSNTNFIQFGYWDASRDGLLAGERLYVGLKQLEAAYQEKRGYDFENGAMLSLRQINPLALLALKGTGSCEFALPEILFDMVRPGDYMRRIKTVAVTVPCVVGPFATLSCTLRLLEHKFRQNGTGSGKADYPERTDGSEDRFSTANVPIAAIATSTSQNDSGVFELNFRDERYLPFEGAGVISKWRLELPAALRQFDYESITDVVIHLRYTSVDGGDALKQAAGGAVGDYVKAVDDLSQDQGLFSMFDLRHDYPNQWYAASQVAPGATAKTLVIDDVIGRLSVYVQGRDPKKLQATDIYLFTTAALKADALTLTTDAGDTAFTAGAAVDGMNVFVAHDAAAAMTGWQLKIQDVKTAIDDIYLVLRFVML
jgi:hypothetical protein